MLSETIRLCLNTLMDDEPVLISQNIPFQYAPSHPSYATSGHSPTHNAHVHHYSHIEPARGCVLAWLALEDVLEEAGPMWVCPGSHKINTRLFDDLLAANPNLKDELAQLRDRGGPYVVWVDWFTRMQEVMTNMIEESIEPEKRIPILIKHGDLVLFDPALSHGTMPPADLEKTRWSIVAKYQGRNAIERSWASWLGHSVYESALKHVPPASFETAMDGGGYYAIDPLRDHLKMFWSQPLPTASSC